MKMNIFYRRFLFCLILFFYKTNLFSQVIKHEVVIKNSTGSQLNLYYHNTLYMGTPVYISPKSEIKIEIEDESMIINSANQFFYKIKGTDTLEFKANENVVAKGPNSKKNLALNYLYSKGYRLRQILSVKYKRTIADYKDYSAIIQNEKSSALIELDYISYLNNDEKKEINEIINVAYFGFLIRPKYTLLFKYRPSISSSISYIYDSVLKFDYKYLFVYAFLADEIVKFSLNQNDQIPEVANTLYQNYKPSKYRDMMLARLFVYAKMKNDTLLEMSKVLSYIQDSTIKRSITEYQVAQEEKIEMLKNRDIFYNISKHKISIDSIVYKYDLVLFDFWATWCGPCVREFKYGVDLSSNIKNDRFKIIYLSLDEDFLKWTDIQSRFNFMNQSNAFFLGGGFKSKIASRYKINTIPRYMLIKGDGTILSSDAPPPSDPRLKLLIEKHIKK